MTAPSRASRPAAPPRTYATASRPRARTPAGDDPLAALIAELAVRAADTHAPQAALESEALTLELNHLDREISATRAAGTGDVAPLVSRRQTSATARSRWRSSSPSRPSDSRPPVMRTYVPARLAWGRGRRRRLGPHPRVTESATSPSDAAAGFCPDVRRP